jgi:hypothetical protein
MSHVPVTSTPVTQNNSPVCPTHNHFTETSCVDTPLSTQEVADDNGNLSAAQEGVSATSPSVRRSGRSPRKKSLYFDDLWPLTSRANYNHRQSKAGSDFSLPLSSDELNQSDSYCVGDVSLLSKSSDSCKVMILTESEFKTSV